MSSYPSRMMTIITSILGMLHNGFVLSKAVIFILGLVFSHALANKAVDVFADFLRDNKGYDLWKATMLVNFLDGLSAVLKFAVIHVSEAYIGRFMAIIFCTAAFTMGLVLLSLRGSAPGIVTLIFAIVLTALGTAATEPTLREFFDHQLSEKVKRKCTQKKEGEDKESSSSEEKDQRSNKNDGRTSKNLWWSTASVIASVIAALLLGSASWSEIFAFSFSIMGSTCLLFIIGIFWYYPQEEHSESPLTIIYRVFNAAYKNRRLSYPSSVQGYNTEDSDDLLQDDLFYGTQNGDVHVLPRHPSFLSFLDRAAITNSDDVCTVVQVRDVKSLYLIIPLGLTFFAYSLVSASGNTYFVLQTTNLTSYSIGDFDVSIMVFFAMKSLVTFVVRTIQSRYKVVTPLRSMAVGMLCSVLCCLAAWQVERLSLKNAPRDDISLNIMFSIPHHKKSTTSIKSYLFSGEVKSTLANPHDVDSASMSIMILTPQYFLLGLMEGFAEGGLETLLSDRLYSESMKKFVDPCIEMLLAFGKFCSFTFALIFDMWLKEAMNGSHLDWYFLGLASLSFVYLGIYVFYAKFKLQNPQLVVPETIQETVDEWMDVLQVQVDINK